MGPGGIQKGSYDASKLTQDQRNWLYQQFGHQGQAPVGYGGEGDSSGNGNSASQDPVALAKTLQQFNVQANQPAIQTLTTQKQSLADQYKQLLDSVLQSGTVSENQATTAENNLLAQRGITNDSPLYGQQMSSALLPVESQYKSLAANVGMGSAQDINQIASQIASLQTGNPEAAISGAGNFANLYQQAQLLPSQIFNTYAQGSQTLGANAVQEAIARINNQYKPITAGDFLINTGNNSWINPSQLMQASRYAAGRF